MNQLGEIPVAALTLTAGAVVLLGLGWRLRSWVPGLLALHMAVLATVAWTLTLPSPALATPFLALGLGIIGLFDSMAFAIAGARLGDDAVPGGPAPIT